MTGAMAAPEPTNPNFAAAAAFDAPPTVSTGIAEIGTHVTGLTSVPAHQLPVWIQDLVAPIGWLIARVDNQPAVARVALFGPMADASWTAAETISVFRFTGVPPVDLLRAHNGRPLRDLHADSITTYPLDTPSRPDVTTARSEGYFTTVDKRTWGQCSSYLVGSHETGAGLLIEQVIFVEAAWRARLRGDIAELADTVHEAFLTYLDTVGDDTDSSPTTEVPCNGA
jgi:hypothetical protein